MTYDNEAIVRHAYHTAEGNVLDVAGFVGSFTDDGVFNDVVGQESYLGEQLGEVVLRMGKLIPDVHRELHRVTVLGDVVAVELSIQGTFLGPLETPAGIVQPTGAKIDVPTADFWYLRDGKVETFKCYAVYIGRKLAPELDASGLKAFDDGPSRPARGTMPRTGPTRRSSPLPRPGTWTAGSPRACGRVAMDGWNEWDRLEAENS
ncbi:MAG TPA: nuclear transport factor 2 family protein [Actinophytocola sp.]|nr:nuclear transport factor 2 family protein [Actinophytocola sp.]